MEEENIDNIISRPGALSVLYVNIILLPLLGLFPSEIVSPALFAFSLPIFYTFLINVIFNREINLKKHILITLLISYILYLLTKYPFNPTNFYVYSVFFVFGALYGLMGYYIYHFFYWLAKNKYGEITYRKRFVYTFIPSFCILFMISVLLSSIFGGLFFNLQNMLT